MLTRDRGSVVPEKRTMNYIRGPMFIGQGKKGSMHDNFSCKMNLGGPSKSDCNKEQPGYTVRSGVIKVPLRRKFVGLFRPNSVAEYRVVSIFTQKTEQETVHPNIV